MEPLQRLSVNSESQYKKLANLPTEILLDVFTYLNPQQVCTMRLVCKRWKEIAEDRFIWKQLFRKQFPMAYRTHNPNLNFWEAFGSIQKRIKVSSHIRFKKFRVEEDLKITHPRFKWPWVFGTCEQIVVLWNVETRKTHLLQLQPLMNVERFFIQPLALKKGSMYVIASNRSLGFEGCALHEADIKKGTINRSYRLPAATGRFLHFKKGALYFVVHNLVQMWRLQDQNTHVLIEKKNRISTMLVKGSCIALVGQDKKIDLHDRLTGILLQSLASDQLITLGKHLNFGVLVFTLNEASQLIEAREAGHLRLVTTYPFRVIAQGFNYSQLSEVAVDEDFLVVKMVHSQNPPLTGTSERQSTLEFFDIESGNSISVIRFDKEPFGLFFKNGKIFYQVKEIAFGKEKIKTEWVDFNNENSSKRETCVIS